MALLPSKKIEDPLAKTGRFMYVDYGVDGEPWHERYVYAVLENRHCVVVTPDHDVYVEVMQVGQGCFRNMRLCPEGSRAVPAGLGSGNGQPCYRFDSHIMPHAVMLQAKKLYDKEKRVPHLPFKASIADEGDVEEEDLSDSGFADGGPAPFDFGSVSTAIGRVGGRWTVVGGSMPERLGEPGEFHDSLKFARFDFDSGYVLGADDNVQLLELWPDPGFNSFAKARSTAWAALDGDKTPGGEAEDARTLAVHWAVNGQRARPFMDSARMQEVSEMDEKDFPLDGPLSLAWFINAMANSGTTPLLRHGKWVAESGVGADSRSAHEHSILSHVLEKSMVVDQLNVVNLVSMEIVGRRLILLEEAHSVDPGAPSFEGWEHWLGLGERRAGVLIPPELSRFVAKRVGDEAAVAKERRKAKEERRLGKHKPGKGEGKGKTKDDNG